MAFYTFVLGYFVGVLTSIAIVITGITTDISGPECERISGVTCSIQWVPSYE